MYAAVYPGVVPSTVGQVSSAPQAVLFSPVAEAFSVSLLALDAEVVFAEEVDWPAAPPASAAPVLAGAAGRALTVEGAPAVLAAEPCAPAAREKDSTEVQVVRQG